MPFFQLLSSTDEETYLPDEVTNFIATYHRSVMLAV